jgi:glycosyltransferase involved in cell wall biosynthesis
VAPDEGKAPLFSILLPTHNRADVLPFAIRSVLWQTLESFEVLIVGDGCTDKTADVIADFQDDRFRWFDLPKGPHFGYGNRNVALREAKGTYIAFMAHDDLWLPDHLQLLGDCLKDDRIEIAYSRPLWVAPDGEITPSTYNLNHPATLEAFLAGKPHSIPAGCVVHRRSCFSTYGFWNDSLPRAGDQELWARFIDGGGGKNFVYLPDPTCLHFKAIWKTERNTGPAELTAWKLFQQRKPFTPAALKVAVPEGRTEQEAFWKAMALDPASWARDLRAAVHLILDHRISVDNEVILQTAAHRRTGRLKLRKAAQTFSILIDDIEDVLRWVLWGTAARWRSFKRFLSRVNQH